MPSVWENEYDQLTPAGRTGQGSAHHKIALRLGRLRRRGRRPPFGIKVFSPNNRLREREREREREGERLLVAWRLMGLS